MINGQLGTNSHIANKHAPVWVSQFSKLIYNILWGAKDISLHIISKLSEYHLVFKYDNVWIILGIFHAPCFRAGTILITHSILVKKSTHYGCVCRWDKSCKRLRTKQYHLEYFLFKLFQKYLNYYFVFHNHKIFIYDFEVPRFHLFLPMYFTV